jgi:hypothetical protein
MKRFIIISLLTVLALPMSACIWFTNYNNYLFSPYDMNEFRSRVEATCNDNWKAYLGSKEEYYWFDADEAIKTARKKNDLLMVTYIQNLQKYLQCADEKRQEQWDYPTKEQLAKRRQTLITVRNYAQTKLKTRLRSQHALLVMRCNMLLGEHPQNVTFWNTTGSTMIESVYRDMMRNIFAGALYKTGSEYEASQVFAEQGDWESLMTMYYEKRSCAAIRQEYQRHPDSAVLPFLLKDFVNNAQEAIDAGNDEEGFGGKLFIRDITKQEARQMCQLCQQVVREGKTDVPVMWQSAKAWLEFLFDNKQQAVSDITKAETMGGTQRMKDNARVLKFYITASQMPDGKAFDNYVAEEMEWLDTKLKDNVFFSDAQARITHQILMKRYNTQPNRLLAIEKVTGCSEYDDCIDTIKVESLLKYMVYTQAPSANALDRYLKNGLKNSPKSTDYEAQLNDLVGTKYMRLCQWDRAIGWIQKVPLSFYQEQGYARYATFRKFNVEPWVKRQWDDEERPQMTLKTNPKLAFVKEMQQMEASEKVLTGKALQQCYYDQAVRYAQASYTGDCWYVMRNTKSVMDTVRLNETDLAAKAATLLRKASATSDFALKEKALFGLSYVYMNPSRWYDDVWDDNTYEYSRKSNRQSTQWQAFATLAEFEKKNATRTSSYVSRCDEYQQFLKRYRQ